MKMAVQQMMLGSVCPDENKTLEVLKQIKEAGYEGIELNEYMIHPTPIFVRGLTKVSGMPSGNLGRYDWPKLLKESGLKAVSLHTDLDSLEKNFETIQADARALHTDTLVITAAYHYPFHKKDKVLELSDRLNACGARAKENGLSLLYHNHNIEFMKVDEKRSAFDLLVKNTDPDFVNFEVDCFWAADAGKDPLKLLKKLRDRLKLIHVTDRGVRIFRTPITPIVKYDSVELGCGNLDIAGILEYGKEKDLPYCVLESHRNWINGSPLDSILLSGELFKDKL